MKKLIFSLLVLLLKVSFNVVYSAEQTSIEQTCNAVIYYMEFPAIDGEAGFLDIKEDMSECSQHLLEVSPSIKKGNYFATMLRVQGERSNNLCKQLCVATSQQNDERLETLLEEQMKQLNWNEFVENSSAAVICYMEFPILYKDDYMELVENIRNIAHSILGYYAELEEGSLFAITEKRQLYIMPSSLCKLLVVIVAEKDGTEELNILFEEQEQRFGLKSTSL